MDMVKLNAAVKIKISLDRLKPKVKRLEDDLRRLRTEMSADENNEYLRRTQ